MALYKRYSDYLSSAILAAIVQDDTVCKYIYEEWERPGPFLDQYQNMITGWIMKYFKKHRKAPGVENLDALYAEWGKDRNLPDRNFNEGDLTSLDKALHRLYDSFTEKTDTAYILEIAEKHINRVRMKRQIDEVQRELDGDDLEKAEEKWKGLKLVSFNGQTDGLFPIFDMPSIFTGKTNTEPYLIDRIMTKGQPCIIAGPHKTMKTSIALDLAVSLASDSDFLGQFQVIRPSNVLLMSGESGVPTLKKNLRTLQVYRCPHLPIDRWPKKLELSNAVPQFADAKHLKELRVLLERREIEVLIIDTAAKALPGETMSNMVINYELCSRVGQLCEELAITFVLLHHTAGRLVIGRVPEIGDIAYAGFKEYFRQWIMLNRRTPYQPPDDLETPRVHQLWVNCGGSAGHSQVFGLDIDEGSIRRMEEPDRPVTSRVRFGSRFSVRRGGPAWMLTYLPDIASAKAATRQSESRANLPDDKRRVMEVLTSNPEGLSMRGIQREVKPTLQWLRLKPAIDELINDNQIIATDIVINNRKTPGYRILNNGSSLN